MGVRKELDSGVADIGGYDANCAAATKWKGLIN